MLQNNLKLFKSFTAKDMSKLTVYEHYIKNCIIIIIIAMLTEVGSR